MMTALGNKKNVKIFSFALAGVFIASVGIMAIVSMGDTANAAPTSDIGVVDQRQVISDNGTLALDYQKKLKERGRSFPLRRPALRRGPHPLHGLHHGAEHSAGHLHRR